MAVCKKAGSNYSPFGLAMSGISSKAAGKLENKKNKFQGQEYNDDLGVNMYEFRYRMHDPQRGQFWQVDPLAEKYTYNSPYAFSENKVTGHVELEGLESANANDVNNPYLRAAMKENVQKDLESMKRNGAEGASVKVSVGVGVGVKAGVGKLKLEAKASGPQMEAGVNGGGQIDIKGSLSGVNGSAEVGGGKVKAGANVGVVQFKDGKVTADMATAGVSADLSASKTLKDGNLSQDAKMNVLDVTATVGINAGIVGGEASFNLAKTGAAIVDAFKAFGNWMVNYVKDAAPKRPTPDQIPK